MKKIFILFVFACFALQVNAQPYKTGIGLRGGWASGITVKHFTNSNTALEGILSTRFRGLLFTGLYEKQLDFGEVKGLDWFYGVGAHVGFYQNRYYVYKYKRGLLVNEYPNNFVNIGIDGIIGLEYTFEEIPVSLSADVKPFFDIVYPGPGWWAGALSIRFLIK